MEYKEPRALEKNEIIKEQCQYCRYFNVENAECHFAIEYGWKESMTDVEWYRKNDPDSITVTQDCMVFPLSQRNFSVVPNYNQQ